MNNKSIRDYINLIENAQKNIEESTDFAGRPVDQELVKRQEKYWNQSAKEKKQQELKRSRQLKKEAKSINEGVMDQIKNIYRGILYDNEPLSDDKFLSVWQRSIQKHLGKTIDIDTLARLHQEFRNKYRRLARRGEALKWDQEMGQMWEQGVAEEQLEETTPEAIEKVERLARK
jgi:hypothetical protein